MGEKKMKITVIRKEDPVLFVIDDKYVIEAYSGEDIDEFKVEEEHVSFDTSVECGYVAGGGFDLYSIEEYTKRFPENRRFFQ